MGHSSMFIKKDSTAMFPGFYEIREKLGSFDSTSIETEAYNKLWPDVHIKTKLSIKAYQMVGGHVRMPFYWGRSVLRTTTGENLQ